MIARALAKRARLLILDEPTAALTENESLRLFDRMRALKARGVAIIFVSHRLAEVFAISDRIVVMRDGRIRGSHAAGDVTRQRRRRRDDRRRARAAAAPARTGASASVALELRALERLRRRTGGQRVAGLDLAVRKGEIVGLFGLLGAGCIEAALADLRRLAGPPRGRDPGRRRARSRSAAPDAAVALGLGLMAQDRRDCLIGEQSIADNIGIASLDADRAPRHARRRRRPAARRRPGRSAAASRRPRSTPRSRTLSGGNQQKVQIARWLAAESRILIMIDPTRGVDVGARREIKRIWSELGARGHAILLASTDAEELVDTCDRVVVMSHGRARRRAGRRRTDRGSLLRMATDG